MTRIIDLTGEYQCSICGKKSDSFAFKEVTGYVLPFNPINKWWYKKPKYHILWLCELHRKINDIEEEYRKIKRDVKEC